jgi:hypothetical protein
MKNIHHGEHGGDTESAERALFIQGKASAGRQMFYDLRHFYPDQAKNGKATS